MPLIANKGNPAAPVHVIADYPLTNDWDKGYMFSSGLGYVWDKMMQEAGLSDYYVTTRHPDRDDLMAGGDYESYIGKYKPPIIIPLDNSGAWFSQRMQKKHQVKKNYNPDVDSEISKYAGSLLTADCGVVAKNSYPHYVIPTYGPSVIAKQWKERDIVISCDLSKAASELEYWKINHDVQPLPQRNPKIDFESFDELLYLIDSWLNLPYISNDIETVYPKAPTKTQPSQFYKILPGYPITIGLAPDPTFGISFDLFRESTIETRELWKHLAKLLNTVPSIGQNFFNFDACFYEMLGFKLPLEKCRDTMILHHLLWAELPHKLQFLARQYTREPYWKDEGAGWSAKNMRGMKFYNCKDVMVTYEIFEAEMQEIKERGIE